MRRKAVAGEIMPAATKKLRCAVYTRKSTDEGLDKEFNTLDAQREACEAYVASQRAEGWTLVRDRYDDGGFSGGTLERPALKRLLADIEQGLVDVIVVYKIDRLSRSLMDFAKLVETMETHGVTFVSVTQSFNTTTSMGRLTLNILLSFAQFEREVIGERIRDKVAASRKRGMWMGGFVPLGYDVRERKLVVNDAEAAVIRRIFCGFVETESGIKIVDALRADGVTTKRGRPLTRAVIGRAAELYQEWFADPDGRVRATFEIISASGWAPHESQQAPLKPGSAKTRLADALGVKEHRPGDDDPTG